MILNPGAHIDATAGDGWTNTVEQARVEALRWLGEMREQGMDEVELLPGEAYEEGRWRFRFRHTVTGVEVELRTHGINDVRAYEREHIFTPKVYWNGSSCSDPEIGDFAAPGFRVHLTLVRDVGPVR